MSRARSLARMLLRQLPHYRYVSVIIDDPHPTPLSPCQVTCPPRHLNTLTLPHRSPW